ncbi:LysM peptidoglycan-binding domain-containing protein [Aquitalea sp. LB_tupeE]|uniref:lytic transglycosylase n=1 Tax=Aquitalea sp. LB_tupeE TaxID=2748078 RepID=UPI0015BAE4E0|nr:LysM peptidoglycan-binding domain-containing protein [Aquitalea sp. LB_tupeE]NWK76839.1 LysM peptidoglycan-binding domain-containing protein [Aquitalea sp. LB_tupeE]
MKRITPLALSLSFAFSLPALAHADSGAFRQSVGVDEAQAAGLDMMLLNSSLLRNGDNVWERAREGFQLTEVNADIVRKQERLYSSKPEYFKRILDRGHKYLFHIMNEVERRGMPTEIAFLPVVESAFVPTANSPVGAAGLWQFMPATGRHYGLEQTWWYDGRRDIMEATRAALDYLQNLYAQFGDWNLALAAYNWGEGNLARAIARAQAAGLEPTYENIKMPNETRNYAPKLIAVRNILSQPEKYGIRLDKFPNKPYFIAVSTGRHMDIEVAAKMAGMSVAEFKELNPAFNLPVYAHKPGRQMLIPLAKADKFDYNLAHWDKPLLSWQVYTPTADENVASVAERYGMSPGELQNVNKLGSRNLTAGRPLLVALRGKSDGATPLDSTDNNLTTNDSLIASAKPQPVTIVAEQAKPVTVAINTPTVAKQQPLAASIRPVAETSSPAITVASAEQSVTPSTSTAAAVTTSTIPALNSVATVSANVADVAETVAAKPASKPQVLAKAEAPSLPSGNTPPPKPLEARLASVNPAASQHTVVGGDTLFNISRRYNVSVADLKSYNNLSDNTVKLGQVIRVKPNPLASNTMLAEAVPAPSAQDEALVKVSSGTTAATGAVPAEYVVQRGDTVYSIARRFGVNHADIQRWNDANQLIRLQPGQRVRIETQGL